MTDLTIDEEVDGILESWKALYIVDDDIHQKKAGILRPYLVTIVSEIKPGENFEWMADYSTRVEDTRTLAMNEAEQAYQRMTADEVNMRYIRENFCRAEPGVKAAVFSALTGVMNVTSDGMMGLGAAYHAQKKDRLDE